MLPRAEPSVKMTSTGQGAGRRRMAGVTRVAILDDFDVFFGQTVASIAEWLDGKTPARALAVPVR